MNPETPQTVEEIKVCSGKYTIQRHDNGQIHALRYGQPWRDLTGDGMVLALFHEIQDLRLKSEQFAAKDAQLEAMRGALQLSHDAWHAMRKHNAAARVAAENCLDETERFQIERMLAQSPEAASAEVAELRNRAEESEREARTLREQLDGEIEDFLNEKACCTGAECGCGGVTRLQQYVAEEADMQLCTLREEVAELRKDKERLEVLEILGETAYFPDWDDNGFWHAKVKGERVIGATLRQFCDAAIAARTTPPQTPASKEGKS
jgi:hypothetical protein